MDVTKRFAWRIRHWDKHFETHESRKRKRPMDFVMVPTRHDGRGFRRVTKHPQGALALAGWYVTMQVAAKMTVRGLLAEYDGPLDAEALADKTGLSEDVFKATFDACSDEKTGWLERVPWDPQLSFDENVAIAADRSKWPPPADFCRDLLPSAAICRDLPSPADLSRDLPPSAAISRDLPRSAARERERESTEKEREKEPALPDPRADLSDEIGLDEAKVLLPALFGRKKNHWSREELGLLDDVIPLQRGEYLRQKAWFELPDDHPIFQETRRKQSLLYFLREYGAENDKIRKFAPQFMNGEGKKREEPPLWREFFEWAYEDPERDRPIDLPASFWKLEASHRKKYFAEFAKFELQNVKR